MERGTWAAKLVLLILAPSWMLRHYQAEVMSKLCGTRGASGHLAPPGWAMYSVLTQSSSRGVPRTGGTRLPTVARGPAIHTTRRAVVPFVYRAKESPPRVIQPRLAWPTSSCLGAIWTSEDRVHRGAAVPLPASWREKEGGRVRDRPL